MTIGWIGLTFLLLFFGVRTPTLAAPDELAFVKGEKLLYDISWSGILTAGRGLLETSPIARGSDGSSQLKFKIVGQTVGLVGALYPVRDETEAIFDLTSRKELETTITIKEVRYRKRKRMIFDRDSNVAIYILNDKEPERFAIKPDTQGPVSALFVARSLLRSAEPGATLTISIFDNRELYNLDIHVLKRERIETPHGHLATKLVEATLLTDGVFRTKGSMRIWFSDDDALAPVRMETKIFLGSIRASLAEANGAPINFEPIVKEKRREFHW